MGVWLHPDGRRETVTPRDGVAFTEAELVALVDGDLAVVAAPPDLDGEPCYFVLHVDGWARVAGRREPVAWPINWNATIGWHLTGGDARDVIVGAVVVVRRSELGATDAARS